MPTYAPRLPVARKAPSDDQTVPAKLKRLVESKRRGRSDAVIAKAAGMTASKLSQLLTGHIEEPRFTTVAKVLRALPATLKDFDEA